MSIKLVATDLDGTLLRSDLTISDRTVATVQRAIEQGVIVTVATGRMYCSALPHAQRLGVNVPLITYNGALIKDAQTGKVLYERPLEEATAAKILAVSREKGWRVQSYLDDVLHVPCIDDMVRRYAQVAAVEPVCDGEAFFTHPGKPHKMLLLDTPDKLPAIQAEMSRLFGDELHITTSKPTLLEFLHPQVCKGVAIAFLAERFGIKREEIMTIGDSSNDLEMIEYAGWGVAVANASEKVRATANAITTSHDEDGVAVAIERFVLGQGR